MKKTVCLALCCILFVTCSSACVGMWGDLATYLLVTPHTVTGLSNFSECSNTPTLAFLPNGVRLWEEYEYIEGDFYYHKETFISASEIIVEAGLVYLTFDDNVYQTVKQFISTHSEVFENRMYLYNDYHFYENTSDYFEGNAFDSPVRFTLTAFNNKNNTILFLGFYATPPMGDTVRGTLGQFAEGNIQPFLEEYFPMYDFSE